jgi:UDP-N-acetylmuramoylalanine--D-glutamate ligase
MKNWQGVRVLIIGAARQGLALARFLVKQGADVTLNDQHSSEEMQDAVQTLAGLPINWVLGGHPKSLLEQKDLICLSGGVPLNLPIVQEGVSRGIELSNDSQIFMENVSCKVIGITGSAGKTTTSTLVGRMAQPAMPVGRKAWVGGNIGLPLIEYLDQIHSKDVVILELSSFQLEQMTISPHISAILNITPNHLDRHGSMESYTAAKAHILDFQSPQDSVVLGRDDLGAWQIKDKVKGKLVSFGFNKPEQDHDGTYFQNGSLYMQSEGKSHYLFDGKIIQLRGEHNRMNVLAACSIGWAAGFHINTICKGVEGFTGVAHRLEFVRSLHGVAWYNDSIATAPERTMAAIRSFNEPLVLLLGGRDKNLPWKELAQLVHQRVNKVVVFGESAPKILKAIASVRTDLRPEKVVECLDLQEAVQQAASLAQKGDIVLLSPGGTSFDEFKDFEERGERFRLWVNQLS